MEDYCLTYFIGMMSSLPYPGVVVSVSLILTKHSYLSVSCCSFCTLSQERTVQHLPFPWLSLALNQPRPFAIYLRTNVGNVKLNVRTYGRGSWWLLFVFMNSMSLILPTYIYSCIDLIHTHTHTHTKVHVYGHKRVSCVLEQKQGVDF